MLDKPYGSAYNVFVIRLGATIIPDTISNNKRTSIIRFLELESKYIGVGWNGAQEDGYVCEPIWISEVR